MDSSTARASAKNPRLAPWRQDTSHAIQCNSTLRFALLLALSSVAATSAPALDPALLKRLEAVDAKAAAVTALKADFEQKKFSPLLKKPRVTRGTVLALGDAMLWDTTQPAPQKLRIDGKSLQLFDAASKTLEIYPVQGKLAAMAASPLPRLSTLREKFDFAADPDAPAGSLALRLTPRDAELAKYVDHVRVRLNETAGVIEFFELTDPDGERTEINFTAPTPNAPLTAKDLEITVHAGTKTVRPLDAASP